MSIVSIIQSCVSAINVTPTLPTDPFFAHSEQYEFNLADDTSLPIVYLEHPVKGNDKILPQGNCETTYTINVFILDKSNLEDLITQRQVIIDNMHIIKRQFILRLRQHADVKDINSVSHVEVYNVLDMNLDGLWLTISVTLLDNAPVCLT
jgi:hypothetical protein